MARAPAFLHFPAFVNNQNNKMVLEALGPYKTYMNGQQTKFHLWWGIFGPDISMIVRFSSFGVWGAEKSEKFRENVSEWLFRPFHRTYTCEYVQPTFLLKWPVGKVVCIALVFKLILFQVQKSCITVHNKIFIFFFEACLENEESWVVMLLGGHIYNDLRRF